MKTPRIYKRDYPWPVDRHGKRCYVCEQRFSSIDVFLSPFMVKTSLLCPLCASQAVEGVVVMEVMPKGDAAEQYVTRKCEECNKEIRHPLKTPICFKCRLSETTRKCSKCHVFITNPMNDMCVQCKARVT
jgi:hypothetical protein